MNKYLDLNRELRLELDEDILDILDHVLVGIFKGDFETSSKVTNYLMKVLSTSELDGAYKILFTIISGMDGYNHNIIYADNFDSDLLSAILEKGITMLVTKHKDSFEGYIKKKGLEYRLDNAKGVMEFTNFLYGETLRKYKDIMDLNPNQVDTYLEKLADELRSKAIGEMLLKVGQILTQSHKMGKELYYGPEAALEANRSMEAYITEKYALTSSKQQRYTITETATYEKAIQMERDEAVTRGGKNNMFEDLFNCHYGLLNLNIMRGDIFTIIGDEGVGKTKALVEQVYYALQAKHNVLFVCTETKKIIIQNMIWARHIYEETGMQISETELLKFPAMIENERDIHIRREMEEDYAIIQDCIRRMYDKESFGTLSLVQSAMYSEIKSMVDTYSKEYDGTIIAIDSISFLDSTHRTNDKENLDALMKDIEDCANDIGMTFLLTTHTSSDANKATARGKTQIGVRIGAGSGHVTKISTLVVHIYTTPELERQHRYVFEGKKTRYRDKVTSTVIMERLGACNHYMYKDENQASTSAIDELSDEGRFLD